MLKSASLSSATKSYKRKSLFLCVECNYTSTNKSHFTRHTMRHTGERPYMCTLCGKGFITGHHLRYHLSNVHKKDLE